MTSKPLHRAGDQQPRAEWPPPTVEPGHLEADGDDRFTFAQALAAGIALAVIIAVVVVVAGLAAARTLGL